VSNEEKARKKCLGEFLTLAERGGKIKKYKEGRSYQSTYQGTREGGERGKKIGV